MAHHWRAGIRLGTSLLIVLLVMVGDQRTEKAEAASAATAPAPTPGRPFDGTVRPPSGILPVVVDLPSSVDSPEQARPFFDDFSWRSFIALNWPAVPGKHGVPKSPNDPKAFLDAGKNYPTVWGTDREAYELYRIDDAPPAAFASSATTNTVCG